MALIFGQNISNSTLLKVRKNEKDISITFWVIEKTKLGGGGGGGGLHHHLSNQDNLFIFFWLLTK